MNQSTPCHDSKFGNLTTSTLEHQLLFEQDAEVGHKTFRDHQNKLWDEAFHELLQYRKRYGNCDVPHEFHESPRLARWVKRQRYQYKRMKNGKSCTINEERIRRLEANGFVWESHNSVWYERIAQLRQFKAQYGNLPTPKTCKRDQKLANWIKQQRRQYALFCQGRLSTITLERIEELQSLGFEWCRRRR
jgi:Helicase associated domain